MLGETATGGHSPLRVLGSRPWPGCFSEGEQATSGCLRPCSWLFALTRSLDPLPWLTWFLHGGKAKNPHQAGGAHLSCCRQVIKSASEKGRSVGAMATRGSGAEPKARRAGLPKCCEETPGGVPRQDTAKGGTRGRIGDKTDMWQEGHGCPREDQSDQASAMCATRQSHVTEQSHESQRLPT